MPKRKRRRIEYVRLGAVEFATKNPKLHEVDGVAGSISRFGMAAVPTRDDRTGRLVAGHGRIEALRHMQAEGQDPPSGVKRARNGEWLVPLLVGWSSRSDAEAASYLVGDNQWTARGRWEYAELAEMLGELKESYPDLLEHTGITLDRLEDIVAGLESPEDEFGGDGAGGGDGDGDKPDWPVLAYQVPRDVFNAFNTVMQLASGNNDTPEHARLQRVGDLATAALERDL